MLNLLLIEVQPHVVSERELQVLQRLPRVNQQHIVKWYFIRCVGERQSLQSVKVSFIHSYFNEQLFCESLKQIQYGIVMFQLKTHVYIGVEQLLNVYINALGKLSFVYVS